MQGRNYILMNECEMQTAEEESPPMHRCQIVQRYLDKRWNGSQAEVVRVFKQVDPITVCKFELKTWVVELFGYDGGPKPPKEN